MSGFTVLKIEVGLWLEGPHDQAEYSDEWDPLDPNEFEPSVLDARRPVYEEIRGMLELLYAHLTSIGCVRADNLDEGQTPLFHLIVEGDWRAPEFTDSGDADSTSWVNFGQITQPLASLPGAVLKARGCADYADADDTHAFLQAVGPDGALSCWGGAATPELSPDHEEASGDWLARVAVPSQSLAGAFDRLARIGYDLSLYSLFFEPAKVAETDWLVEKVIGFGALTLIVGSGAAGKSSALHELLSATNAQGGPKSFFGQPVTDRYPGVLLSGEETEGALKHRQDRHAKVWRGAEPMIIKGAGPSDLEAALKQLDSVPGKGLLVVDPATTFLDGDETKTHVVSDFYNPLVAFARRKEWAVVVAHHLVKDPPKALSRILPSVKGSTVHTDRARMVIAMIDRRNGTVEVGPIKHNYPEGAWLNVDEGQFLRRDPETFRLLPVDAELPRAPKPEDELLSLLHSVVAELNRSDIPVQRTGGSGLYKLKITKLQGVPRNTIESGILTLLNSGRLINTDRGLVAVPTSSATQLAA